MKNLNSKLQDETIKHMLQLSRFTSGERKKIAQMMKSAVKKVVAKLEEQPSIATRSAVMRYTSEAEEVLRETFKKYQEQFTRTLSELAIYESGREGKIINKTADMDLFKSYGLSKNQAQVLVKNQWIQGKTVSEMLEYFNDSFVSKFTEAVRQGYSIGETVDQMRRRITGYVDKDGILHQGILSKSTRHGAEMLVRTATSGISNEAIMSSIRENSDVVNGFVWVATLDNRTCIECAGLDGKLFDMDMNPIDGDISVAPPPAHFNCRCALSPLVKSFRELGFDFDEIPDGTRASMDGQTPERTTFEEWFDGKGDKFKEDYLGKGRYELWKDKKITFSELVDQNGRELSLEELTQIS